MQKQLTLFVMGIMFSFTTLAQLPQEMIMGKLTFDAGRFGFDGIYDNQADKSGSMGMYYKHSMVMINDRNFTEIGSDIALVTTFQLINGLNNVSRLSFTEVKDYKESRAGTVEAGNRLFYRHVNILSVSQTFKVYDDYMIGYYAGGEGVVANETNSNLTLTEKRTLDVSYWAVGPVLAYQRDRIRVESSFKFFLGKKVSNGNSVSIKADYYLTLPSEVLGVAFGIYAQKAGFGQAKLEGVPELNISSVGLSVSVLYPSLWNLVRD